MNRRRFATRLPALLATVCFAARPAAAERDPTRPPQVAQVPQAGAARLPAAPVVPRHLLVVDGRRFVVDGTRRLGVGDMLGGARIESIEDATVVLRTAAGVQRLSLHPGVLKRPAPDPAPRTSESPPR